MHDNCNPKRRKWNQIVDERAEFQWSKKFSPLEPQDPLGTFYDGCLTMLTQRTFREFEYSTRESPRVSAKISEVAMRPQNVFASFASGIIGEDSPYIKMKSYKGLDGAFASFRFLIPVVIAGGFKAYKMCISYKEKRLKILKQQKSYEVIDQR
ncbi:unnamed protein product [Arabidopsis arenosa]|uniref:Uncharacterized protein n=1 Tax=Arabidopsis arenosa TaxID=38785 RepID=A0A8S1ZVN0_ARAAE|nr:unnamed protein product [Arabidopsis arenosa]